MAFPKFHGIALANNSWIENLHVERLASDPLPISAGRIWYNTTAKALKYSSLDGVGAVIIQTIGDMTEALSAIAAVQSALGAETAARTEADNVELTARQADVAALQALIAQEVADRAAAIAKEVTDRDAAIAVETVARTEADGVTASNAADSLATETTARLAGDAVINTRVDAVQTELDVTQTAAGLNADGTLTAPENTVNLGGISTLKAGLVALDGAIVNEAQIRSATDAAIASQLANEAQLRSDGDANLQAQLTAWVETELAEGAQSDAAEVAARIAGDAALQAELDQTQASIGLGTDGKMGSLETTNFMSAATTVFSAAFALDTQLKVVTDGLANEVSMRDTADTNFTTALNTEIATRISQDTAIGAELNTTQSGAGLESDGTYAAPTGTNYLNTTTSLKDGLLVLDVVAKTNAEAILANLASIDALTPRVASVEDRTTLLEGSSSAASSDIVALKSELNAVEAGAGLSSTGQYVKPVGSAYLEDALSLSDADSRLDAAVKAVAASVDALGTGSITGLQTEVNKIEEAVGLAADGSLVPFAGALSEAGSVRGAVNALEAIVATSGEDIAGLKTASEEAAAAIALEVAARTAADETVKGHITTVVGSINAQRVTVSSASAMNHNIKHDLNTSFFLCNVFVEGTDGVFRNDIVPIEVTDNNNIKISLTEARAIKVSLMSMEAIESPTSVPV
jgi:hypothetical protein